MGYIINSGVKTGGLPEPLIKALIDNCDVPYLVETGTAKGDSARLAATMFEKVWTIELIEDRAVKENAPENLYFLSGSSIEVLPGVISELITLKRGKDKQYVIFYLDAHYSSDVPNTSGHPECPVLNEIKCISAYGEDAIIIIDDARLFFGSPPHPHDPTEWPSICGVFHVLKKCFPYHHITITDDYVLAIPLHIRKIIDDEWRANFNIRYPNDADKLKQQVKDVYNALIEYIK